MIPKIYLIVIGLMYLSLALWCTISPATTSEKVGFKLEGGSGQSEFVTVYGGLEFGLALILLVAAFLPSATTHGVIACILIHASLVVFRSLTLFWFKNIESMTYKLAIGEWVILLVGLAILWNSIYRK